VGYCGGGAVTDLRKCTRQERRAAKTYVDRERLKWPLELTRLSEGEFPPRPANLKGPMPVEVWRSRCFLLQVYPVSPMIERLSVNRTEIDISGNWVQDVSWEELQDLKRQCGRGDLDAVEIYPADADVVNVANMRHLWVLKVPIPSAWRPSR
jgi:hypothetical protein